MATSIEGSDPRLPVPPALTLEQARAYAGFARRTASEVLGYAGVLLASAQTASEEDAARAMQSAAFQIGRAEAAVGVVLANAERLLAEAREARREADAARVRVSSRTVGALPWGARAWLAWRVLRG